MNRDFKVPFGNCRASWFSSLSSSPPTPAPPPSATRARRRAVARGRDADVEHVRRVRASQGPLGRALGFHRGDVREAPPIAEAHRADAHDADARESSARSGPASPYAGVAGAPSRAGAARTPGRISLVERQAQYALPSSASRTRPSGGPGASGTSPVAPAVAARRALAAGSAAPSRTAAAPTPSRGLERGLKTPGERTPRPRRGSRRRRRRRPRRRPSDVRSGENQSETIPPPPSLAADVPGREPPRAAQAPPRRRGGRRHRADTWSRGDFAKSVAPFAPGREAPPRAPARNARRPAPRPTVPVPRSPSPGRPPGGGPRRERIRPRPRPRPRFRGFSSPRVRVAPRRALAPGAPLRVGGRSAEAERRCARATDARA